MFHQQESIPCVGQPGLFHLGTEVMTRLKNIPSIQAAIDRWNRLFFIDYLEDDMGRGLRYANVHIRTSECNRQFSHFIAIIQLV